jgi:hypothetical protein
MLDTLLNGGNDGGGMLEGNILICIHQKREGTIVFLGIL